MGFIASAVIAYLIGSVSCAMLVAKFLKTGDPRTQGSGNAGATNMLRIAGKKAGLIVLGGDALKGLLAVLVGVIFQVKGMALGFVGLAAVVGHVYPVFYKFKGGKGIATTAGVLLPLSFMTFLFAAVTWGVVLFVTRFVSLSSLVAALATPIYLLIGGNFPYFLPFAAIAGLIVWKHLDNIKRLRAGTEPKFDFSDPSL